MDVLLDKKDYHGVLEQVRAARRANPSEFADAFTPNLFPAGKQSLQKASEVAAAHAALGLLLINRRNDFKRAQKEFKAAADADQAFGLAHELLATTYVHDEEHKKAERSALEALRLDPGLLAPHLILGYVYSKSGRPEDAIAAYKAAIRVAPARANTYYMLANLYLEQNRTYVAMEAYLQALNVDPQFDSRAEAHNNLAISYFSLGEYALAWQRVRQAEELGINVYPGFLDALSQRFPPSRLAQLQSEIPNYRDATLQQPTDPQARMKLGDALREVGDLDGAVAAYRAASYLDPKDPDVYVNQVRAYTLKGARQDAISDLQEALEKDANDLNAYFMLGLFYGVDPGEQDQALQHFESFLDLAETNPDERRRVVRACGALGDLLSSLGREREALERYDEGLRLDPTDASLLNNLAWLYVTAKDAGLRNPQRALELAQKAVAATPDTKPAAASYLDTLAEAYYQLGDFDAAIETERKALSLRPDDKSIQQQLGKFEEAKRKGRR